MGMQIHTSVEYVDELYSFHWGWMRIPPLIHTCKAQFVKNMK